MTDAEIQAAIQTGLTNAKIGTSWLKTHERLILVVLGIIGAAFLTNHLLNNWAARDQIQAQTAIKQLNDQKASEAAIAAQLKAATDQYQATITSLQQQNQTLAAAVSNRTIVLQQQQATDKTLPMPDLGKRWADLAKVDPADMTATTSGITVTPSGALATTQALEQIPVLQANVKDTQSQLDNANIMWKNSDAIIEFDKKDIASLNTTISDQDKACTAKLNLANAEAKKGKWKAFWFGVGAGVGATVTAVVAFVH